MYSISYIWRKIFEFFLIDKILINVCASEDKNQIHCNYMYMTSNSLPTFQTGQKMSTHVK